MVPLKVFWTLLAAVVLAVGAVAFVVGAFIMNPRETVRVEVPPAGVAFPPPTAPTLPKPDGPPPADEARAREDVIEAFTVTSAGTSTDEERLARVDDSEGLAELRRQVLVNFPQAPLDQISVRVEEVRFLNQRTAAVRYTIVLPGYSIPEFPNRIGQAVSSATLGRSPDKPSVPTSYWVGSPARARALALSHAPGSPTG